MKKIKLEVIQLQLKKSKIASLTHVAMENIHGGWPTLPTTSKPTTKPAPPPTRDCDFISIGTICNCA